MSLSFEIAGAQIDGARDYQEDAFLVTNLTDKDGSPSALVIVADGMGGHAAGNVASNMAVQAFNKHITSNYPAESLSDILNEAILKANHSISETVKETPALEGMGCTMVAAIFEGTGIYWASVGDSHLYLLRNRELNKINADHSYGGFLDAMEAAGTPVDAEPGLSRNMLMSAITGSDIADIDCPEKPIELKHGDKILICSDGLDTLSQGKIIQYIDWADSSKEAADALLNAVEEADMPKQDNTTAVVITVMDKAAEQATPAKTEEEDDDEEDITDTGYKGATADKESTEEEYDLEATLENIPPEEPPPGEPGQEAAGAEPGGESPATETATDSAAPPAARQDRKGPLIAIAAGVVLVLAIAGYFLTGDETGEEMPEALPPVAEEETGMPAEDVDAAAVSGEQQAGAAAEEETGEEPPADAEESVAGPAPAATEPEPVAEEQAVAEKTVPEAGDESRVFQDDLRAGGTGPAMVWIPGGTFEMGNPASSRFAEERPRHKVTIDRFAISQHEITFAEYDRFARATGRRIPDNQYMDRKTHPVIFVSWDDAYYYARWLSEQTGETYRLPTEAEWEYAASGGVDAPFWWGFEEKSGVAHCFGCGSRFNPRKPAAVGSFQPNPFGVYDTSGNVAEWVHDCWHENYEGAPNDGSVWEGGDCSRRVVRGGSYISPMQSTRVNKRDKFKSDTGYDHIGIRVVREP